MVAVSYLNATLLIFITGLRRFLMPSSGPGSGNLSGAIVWMAAAGGASAGAAASCGGELVGGERDEGRRWEESE